MWTLPLPFVILLMVVSGNYFSFGAGKSLLLPTTFHMNFRQKKNVSYFYCKKTLTVAGTNREGGEGSM
jgi:hypothetical protein